MSGVDIAAVPCQGCQRVMLLVPSDDGLCGWCRAGWYRSPRPVQVSLGRHGFGAHHGKRLLSVAKRDHWICWLCGEAVDNLLKAPHPMSASVDHVIPRADGGRNATFNLRLAHATCNVLRGRAPYPFPTIDIHEVSGDDLAAATSFWIAEALFTEQEQP